MDNLYISGVAQSFPLGLPKIVYILHTTHLDRFPLTDVFFLEKDSKVTRLQLFPMLT